MRLRFPLAQRLSRAKPIEMRTRRYAADFLLGAIVIAVFFSLFEKGPLFLGDYLSAPSINPSNQFLRLFSSVNLSSRNTGYDFRPYIVQWELGSSFVISAIFSFVFGDPSYAKMV